MIPGGPDFKELALKLLISVQMIESIKFMSAEQTERPVEDPARRSPTMSFWRPMKPFVAPFVMNKKSARPVPPINAEQLAAAVPAPSVYPLSILVVEDNRINRMLTLKMLNHFGYTADAVNNGRECMEALAGKAYHLFLMDLQMPVMDGFTAAREIRRWNQVKPATPPPYICALTANVMAKDRAECLAAGMDDFLTKPLRLEALKVVVTRVAETLKAARG
jgi:CheY-like chemotaxis protein